MLVNKSKAYAEKLLGVAENAYSDAAYRFKEELVKHRFLKEVPVRCSDGCREQFFMKQPDSFAVAVRLVPQLERARSASRNSTLSKPARPQLN